MGHVHAGIEKGGERNQGQVCDFDKLGEVQPAVLPLGRHQGENENGNGVNGTTGIKGRRYLEKACHRQWHKGEQARAYGAQYYQVISHSSTNQSLTLLSFRDQRRSVMFSVA